MPKRIQFIRQRGEPMPPGTKLVTRGSRWGNRVSVPEKKDCPAAHQRCVAIYRGWLMAPEQAAYREQVRQHLRGYDLACTCKPHLACHADVLLEVANGEGGNADADPAPG